jgi:cytidylate kinase
MNVVTIDGPAGAGKSTAARGLARRLGYDYLDTGAMFRVVGLALHRAGIAPQEATAVAHLLPALRIDLPAGAVWLNGQEVTQAIRSPEIASLASQVAVIPSVRQALAAQQRAIAQGRQMVCEGRDQGTVVFPDAFCKFYLFADTTERARRRWRELCQSAPDTDFAVVLAAQMERDTRDSGREIAPLRAADDAIHIDTTHLDMDATLVRLEQLVWQRLKQLNG